MRDLSKSLQSREQFHRQRLINQSPVGTEIMVEGEPLLNFCSNDYLGLANDPRIKEACKSGIDQYGVGSGASQLITGYQTAHYDLELALAEFLERPRVLLFSTGYMANIGVISALMNKGDHIIEDRLNHASLIDGARLSDARLHRYVHKSLTSLESELKKIASNKKLIVSDAVFSMDGDLADINGLAEHAQHYNADLMIDDAHGIGVLGKHGAGSLSHAGLHGRKTYEKVAILVGTFGKAFGTFGAFVAGSEELIEKLIQSARSLIYTTAPPAAIASATLQSLEIIKSEEWRRETLSERIHQLQSGLRQIGIQHANNLSPIQPIITGSSKSASELSKKLRQRGVLISAIRPPTVPKNTSRLRITLSAEHTEQQVDKLLSVLDDLKVAESLNVDEC